MLISVNPFKQINGVYSPAMTTAYHGAYSYERAPHIYSPAEETFRALLSTGREYQKSIALTQIMGEGTRRPMHARVGRIRCW